MRGWRAAWVMLAGLWSLPAQADIPAPPVHQTVDANGVDLVSGAFNSGMTDLTIGPAGPHGLSFTRAWNGYGWWNSFANTVSGNTTDIVITTFNQSSAFHNNNGTYVNSQGDGATFSCPQSAYSCPYTARDGTVTQFTGVFIDTATSAYSSLGRADTTTFPDGTVWKYNYTIQSYCDQYYGPYGTCYHNFNGVRLLSIATSLGYEMRFTYASDTLTPGDNSYFILKKVTAANSTIESCLTATCSYSRTWPSVSYTYNGSLLTDVADPMGRSWHYSYDGSGNLTGIRRPGASSDDVSVSYGGTQVTSVTRAGVQTTYNYSGSGNSRTIGVRDSAGTRNVTSDLTKQMVTADQDKLGYTTSYALDGSSRITGVTYPEGNGASYAYDSRGNVTSVTRTPKPGSGLANTVTSAVYPGNCGSAASCNKPTSSTDARGNVTTYAYDTNSGLPTSVTLPAPASGAVQPQMRYSYQTVSSSYGGVNATVTLLSMTSSCRTTSSCSGNADESRTTIAYGDATKNFLPLVVNQAAGDASISASTAVSYDAYGNVVTSTDPRGNTTNLQYNAARQLTLTVGPDPDGSGPLANRAKAFFYESAGLLKDVVSGTANPDGSNFIGYVDEGTLFDAYGRKSVQSFRDGAGTIYNYAQFSYDGRGFPNCVAVRMNPANGFSAASSVAACNLAAAGAYGMDRITETEYDQVGRPYKQWHGYRSSSALNEQKTFTPNGQIQTAVDAKGNVTTYIYDGFDRLAEIRYPNANGGGSSASDKTVFGYDAADNVIQKYMRQNGKSSTYTYDGLNRVTQMTPPGLTWEDVPLTFSYDNFSNLAWSRDTIGHGLQYSYDALGRLIHEVSNWIALDYRYDAVGNRTYIGHGDGYYVNYSYNATNEMTQVTEQGATSGIGVLATIGYDNLGRRIWMNRGNGTGASWVFGANGESPWLTRLIHSASGGAGTAQFDYQYNPAGQLTQRSYTNERYEWNQSVSVNRAYIVNGLNQYTSSGSVNPTYDTEGNVTSAGSATYAYSARNLLVFNADATYNYDPAGRLDVDYKAHLFLGYSGADLIVEKDESNEKTSASYPTLRRYVYGYGGEPLVWYEGSGTSDRRWLAEDERGSVIAVQDGNGNATANQYDEYGIPQSTNVGRFGYTGQAWLPSLGMYYYKARMYSPTLGRFLQTDPIGYGDGMNWYNYVHGDPVNGMDPSGTSYTETLGRDGIYDLSNVTNPSTVARDGSIVVTGGVGVTFSALSFVTTGGAFNGLTAAAPVTLVSGWEPGPFDPCHTLGLEQSCRASPVASVLPQKTPAITQLQGRPAYCFGPSYTLGKDLQSIAKIGTYVGLGASVLGSPEVGLPIAAISGFIDLAGSALEARAGSGVDARGGAVSAGFTAVTLANPPARAVEVPTALAAEAIGQAAGSVMSAVDTDPCS